MEKNEGIAELSMHLTTDPTPSQATDLLLLVGRMDGKLDIMLTQRADHGHRLSALEAWRNRTLGIALAAGAARSDPARLEAGSRLCRMPEPNPHPHRGNPTMVYGPAPGWDPAAAPEATPAFPGPPPRPPPPLPESYKGIS